MKNFLTSSRIIVSLIAVILLGTQAEGSEKWRISSGGPSEKEDHFVVKLDGVAVATLTPSLKNTDTSSADSKLTVQWFVRRFRPSFKDIDNMKMSRTDQAEWPVETQNGPVLIRGMKNGSPFPTLLMLTFKKLPNWPQEMDNARWENFKRDVEANVRDFHLSFMTNFKDSNILAKSKDSAVTACPNCFVF
jgi:hypothetical protein